MIPVDLIENLGSGAGGGLIGALVAWLGIRNRLDAVERAVAAASHAYVAKATCEVQVASLNQRVNNASHRFDHIDAQIEIIRKLLIDGMCRMPRREDER